MAGTSKVFVLILGLQREFRNAGRAASLAWGLGASKDLSGALQVSRQLKFSQAWCHKLIKNCSPEARKALWADLQVAKFALQSERLSTSQSGVLRREHSFGSPRLQICLRNRTPQAAASVLTLARIQPD